MKSVDALKNRLKVGGVYRRIDLQQWSTSVDRHLQELVEDGMLEKLSGGLYYVPKRSVFGNAPADENELIGSFLKDDRFLVMSPNDYNSLGVGTTQLYNTRKVYNYRRHGDFRLGNRFFHFVRKPYVPEKMSKEFLLVDLVNNLKHLAEDQSAILENVRGKAPEMNQKKLKQMIDYWGTVNTKKIFSSILS
ncbi:hypothetical protein [Asinibacterium sp. OR53]|uniref:hypothetical protein n=1 Tax=Asinibacterium sp. OR53 TaxID=925409 RepID=UPI00047BEB6E|nr:hypothetical protein [Asinibacterium sp. OR53]